MASVGAEHEEQINQWIKAFEALPPDRQENLKKWFTTQRIIIDSSGLKPEEWFRYVQWAMDHPLDYSFLRDFPDEEGASAADATEKGDARSKARTMVGGQAAHNAPEGKGVVEKATSERQVERELFNRFMKERLTKK